MGNIFLNTVLLKDKLFWTESEDIGVSFVSCTSLGLNDSHHSDKSRQLCEIKQLFGVRKKKNMAAILCHTLPRIRVSLGTFGSSTWVTNSCLYCKNKITEKDSQTLLQNVKYALPQMSGKSNRNEKSHIVKQKTKIRNLL